MKILVTGGAGYIGSHTCKALLAAGHEVAVFDNLSTGFRDLARWGSFEHGDITDDRALAACLRKHRPDGVIHFAACSYVGESVLDPGKYHRNNVAGTLNLLCGMRDAGVRALVVSGTCAVYGEPEQTPISESCAPRPINPYGRSKLFMEGMLADFERAHGLGWVSLRYFNAAGADPLGECGERHIPESHLIPRLFLALDGDIPALQIFGNDYPTPDGTCIRDYVHVCDLAEAHVKAIEYCLGGQKSQAMNLGAGQGFSVLEILAAAGRILGREAPFVMAPRRPGDPPRLTADHALARQALDWKPRCSDIESIIASAWQWHEKDRPMRRMLAGKL